jgi:hypothetical protein
MGFDEGKQKRSGTYQVDEYQFNQSQNDEMYYQI